MPEEGIHCASRSEECAVRGRHCAAWGMILMTRERLGSGEKRVSGTLGAILECRHCVTAMGNALFKNGKN